MRSFKNGLIVFFALIATTSYAQMTKDNSKWTFEAKKVSGNKYQIITHLQLEKGWHIYAMKPGGDGTLVAPEITVDKNSKVKLSGGVKEKGKLVTQTMEGIDGKVNMYSGKVDYIQMATIDGATTVSGTYSYQICNDRMCLPPTTKKYTLSVK